MIQRKNMQVYAVMAVTLTSTPLIRVPIENVFQKGTMVINVVDAGYPVPGSRVELISEQEKKNWEFITNDQGYAVAKAGSNVEIELESGNYRIKVKKDGFAEQEIKVYLEEAGFVEKIVNMETANKSPKADAGGTQYTSPGTPLWLDGGSSRDPEAEDDPGSDGNYGIESYTWDLKQAPSGSKVKLVEASGKRVRFTPDLPGVYLISLLVSDGEQAGETEHRVEAGYAFTDRPPLPVAMGGHATVRLQNKAYIIGGYNGKYLNSLYIFDLHNQAWTEGPPMPTKRNHLQALEYRGKIYAIGGHDDSGPLSMVEVYDPQKMTWTTAAPMPTARYSMSSAFYQGKFYLFGGKGGPEKLEVFDPQKNQWTGLPNMPVGRFRHTGQLVNNRVYLIGGFGTEQLINSYDLKKGEWKTHPELPRGRYYLNSAVLNQKIYCIGGHGEQQGTGHPSVEVFDPLKEVWSRKNPLPFALDTHTTTVYDGHIFVFGGESKFGASGAVNNVFVYDPQFDLLAEE